ncbi:MAG: class I SAM-dependent methyltransferase [Bacteroidetes bacterium]|nr:MAG: class I SAM-dependent methyltransferase [Bacteroidota bacterium]
MNGITRRLYYRLPPAWRFWARRLYYLPADLLDRLLHRRDPLVPPRGLIYTGGGDFRQTGELLLHYFRTYGGLQSHHAVLDVGSGIGRVALPLTTFLDEQGRYEGFDVVKTGVRWCQKHITSRRPNFRFHYVPLDNDLYRSGGQDATSFHFPYPDADFDFVVVNSVFTHLLPDEVEHYLSEIARVLRPGGVCYATFFLFGGRDAPPCNPPQDFDFPHHFGHYRLMDRQVRSANVAYAHEWLAGQCARRNLRIERLFYGSWRGLPRKDCKEFQDLLFLRKADGNPSTPTPPPSE